MKRPRKVHIFGGTHGNEWTGAAVIEKYSTVLKDEFKDLDLSFTLANPEAYSINRRFKDEDLNRAFEFLHEDRKHSYENQRARELKKMVDEEPCFVIDLHTTTSNMGRTVILTRDHPINFYLGDRLTKAFPDCRVILSPDQKRKYLASQTDLGMIVEVGPTPNGLINGKILQSTLEIIKEVLTSLSNLPATLSGEIEVYEEIQDIYYPVNEKQEITAFIHPRLQDRDFDPIIGKYEAFKSFSGETITLETKEKLFPIFINEAAYYPKLLALTLCRKKLIKY